MFSTLASMFDSFHGLQGSTIQAFRILTAVLQSQVTPVRPSFKSFVEFAAGLWKLGKLKGCTTCQIRPDNIESRSNHSKHSTCKHSEHPSLFSHLVDVVFQLSIPPQVPSKSKVFDVWLVHWSAIKGPSWHKSQDIQETLVPWCPTQSLAGTRMIRFPQPFTVLPYKKPVKTFKQPTEKHCNIGGWWGPSASAPCRSEMYDPQLTSLPYIDGEAIILSW